MKKILNILFWPLLFVVGQFFLSVGMTIIFLLQNASKHENNWVGSEAYTNELAQFLSQYGFVILILMVLIFLPLFYKKYHQEVIENKTNISILNMVFIIILGFSFSLLYNSILGLFSIHFSLFNNFFEGEKTVLGFFGTVLIGPILEEYLFRGIVYHRLQKYYPVMKSLLLTGLIFAIFHQSIIQMIYAFIFNFMLIYVYEKFHTIKAPIMLHICGNGISFFLSSMLNDTVFITSIVVMITSFLLVISYYELGGFHKFQKKA